MRICLSSREVWPFVGGGIATYIYEMSRALVAAGHETHVLTQAFPGLHERAAAVMPGVHFHEVDLTRFPAGLPGAYQTFGSRYAMGVYTELKRLHARHRFDYIELPEYFGEPYFCVRAKRAIGAFDDTVLGVRLHSPLYLCRAMDRQSVLTTEHAHAEYMEKESVRAADLVLSASRAMLDRVLLDIGSAQDDPASINATQVRAVLPLPQDGSGTLESGGDRSLRTIAPDASPKQRARILYYGRIQYLKGVHRLVEEAQQLLERGVDAEFRFIGGDTETGPFGRSMRSFVESRIQPRWRDRFEFLAAVERDALRAEVRRADACCFPSLWESFSMACIEAMALGAVVVASNAGGLGEIVEHGHSGLLCDINKPGELADALARSLTDDALRRHLSAGAPLRAKALSDPNTSVKRLESILSDTHLRRDHDAGDPRSYVASLDTARNGHAASRSTPPTHPSIRRIEDELTVIIPHYNLGPYVNETLESLRSQTVTGFRIILVDDGSTDPASLRNVDQLERAGLRVIRKPNGGLGSARNAGFHAADTRWVLPIDGDDLAHPTLVHRLLTAMRRNPGLASASPLFASFERTPDQLVSGYVPLGYDRDLLAYQNLAGPGGGSILDREAVLAVGGYDEWLTSFEDWDMWCRLAKSGRHGMIVPEFLLYYRLRQGSLIRTEALPRMHMLKAYLMERHADLPTHPDRVLRLQLAETERLKTELAAWQAHAKRLEARLATQEGREPSASPDLITSRARALIDDNLRYRLVDRVNAALKETNLQSPAKKAAMRAIRVYKRVRGSSRA